MKKHLFTLTGSIVTIAPVAIMISCSRSNENIINNVDDTSVVDQTGNVTSDDKTDTTQSEATDESSGSQEIDQEKENNQPEHGTSVDENSNQDGVLTDDEPSQPTKLLANSLKEEIIQLLTDGKIQTTITNSTEILSSSIETIINHPFNYNSVSTDSYTIGYKILENGANDFNGELTIEISITCDLDESESSIDVTLTGFKKYSHSNITLNVKIPDFSKISVFDEEVYSDETHIQTWHYVRVNRVYTLIHKMVPYTLDRSFNVYGTFANTLGDLMDELNVAGKIFEFNLSKEEAGENGRFLYGIQKSEETLKTVNSLEYESYWGIYYEDNGYDMMIKTNDSNFSYISISSKNNTLSAESTYENFDKNESFYTYSYRMPVGVDGTILSSNDIIDLNLWRMI